MITVTFILKPPQLSVISSILYLSALMLISFHELTEKRSTEAEESKPETVNLPDNVNESPDDKESTAGVGDQCSNCAPFSQLMMTKNYDCSRFMKLL